MSTITPGCMTGRRLVVTNADSWVGQCIALYLSKELRLYGGVHLVCTARDPSKCERLKREGCEVMKIDYDDHDTLRHAFKEADGVVIVPELNPKRVEWAKNVAEAMEHEKVHCTLIVSNVGTDSPKKELKKFQEIENEITHRIRNWTIVRKSFLYQIFFLWTSIVQDKGEFPLTITRDCTFAPLDVTDLGCAVACIVQHHRREDRDRSKGKDDHDRQIYTLTGPNKFAGYKIVEELNDALGGQDHVKFREVNRQEMEHYLQSLRQRSGFFSEFTNACVSDGKHDKRMDVPNDTEIGIILDYFEYVREGKADWVSGDFEKITGHRPTKLSSFFEKHSNAFRPRRA